MESVNKQITNISFLNLAAQSPSLELNLAMSEKIHRESNDLKHTFFMCNKALKSCSVNILNKKSICRICTTKAKKGFKSACPLTKKFPNFAIALAKTNTNPVKYR